MIIVVLVAQGFILSNSFATYGRKAAARVAGHISGLR